MSGEAWVCPFRCKSCDVFTLARLPSWVWCPPLLNLWARRRLGSDVVGYSGVDIVSRCCSGFCCVSCSSVCSWRGVMLLSFLCSTCISFEMGGDIILFWVDVGWPAGGDGWVCPNRFFCVCRFGVPCVMSDGVLCAIYVCLVVKVCIIFFIQAHLYSH